MNMSTKEVVQRKNKENKTLKTLSKYSFIALPKEKNKFKQILLNKKLIIDKKSISAKPLKVKRPVVLLEEKTEKHLAIREKEPNPELNSSTMTVAKIESLIESSSTILADAKIAASADDDVNRLIRRMILSFTAKKNEARFSIGFGLFKGANFHLRTKDKNLAVSVEHASMAARNLLIKNRHLLSDMLKKHEINLDDLRFSS